MLGCFALTVSIVSTVEYIAVISRRNTERVRAVRINICIYFICTGY